MLAYDQFGWLLPIPGLFHWYINYIDMIHDLYLGAEKAVLPLTLYHNKNYLSMVQGNKSPFHHKEEVALCVFDVRITACYYENLPNGI
jgi:hypothetical protein